MKKWLVAAASAVLSTFAALAQPAPQAYTLEAQYDVSVLGLSVGSMRLKLALEGDAYRAEIFVKPEGLAGSFAPNTINAVATGRIVDGRAMPDQSWVQQTRSRTARVVQISYAGGTPVGVSVEPAYKPSPHAPTAADWQGTVDPISALISTLVMPTIAPAEAACGETVPVYDGRRRYDFDLWTGGQTNVTRGAGGYKGQALYCVGTYRRVAGWRPDRIGPKYDTKVHGYYAPIAVAGEAAAFYMPVRLWGESEVGDVVAIPTAVSINGMPWQQFFSGG